MTDSAQSWGLLGADGLASVRRVRTLDVGAAVRQFNELAVPGMGSVWTGRQLLWPLLGVAAAVMARNLMHVSNIEAANAVEALGCRIALASNDWQRDPRIRGAQKLRGTENLTFQAMRRPGFYVTQPMRMSAVQPLLALGLVASESERFNAYRLSEAGQAFLDTACDPYPECWYRHGVVSTLANWMTGSPPKIAHLQRLREAITPLAPLPDLAAQTLRELLAGPSDVNSLRRRGALAWVRRCQDARRPIDDEEGPAPAELSVAHWSDLRAGARFFRARDAAIGVLDACERAMGPAGAPLSLVKPLPETARVALDAARAAAAVFLELAEGSSYHASGLQFCRELSGHEHRAVLKQLVGRDGRVLRMSGNEVVPGMAFDGGPPSEEVEAQDGDEATADFAQRVRLPAGVSFRMRNLLLLDLDLQARLSDWLAMEDPA
jgi:hypothetical protein